jgi:hypothetical protein
LPLEALVVQAVVEDVVTSTQTLVVSLLLPDAPVTVNS